MKKLEKTNRKGIYVKYYEATKKGKRVVTAQLTDEFGVDIKGAASSYTMQPYDAMDVAKIAARNRAFSKLDEMFMNAMVEGVGEAEAFFVNRWMEIPEQKRLDLAPASRENKRSKESAITYFANNVLKLLDEYGPFITADQSRNIAEALYVQMLLSKKYKHCYVSEEEAVNIARLTSHLKHFFVTDKQVKRLLGEFPKADDINRMLDCLQAQILGEERLRSLLELALVQAESIDKFVSEDLWKKIESDSELVAKLKKLKKEKNRTEAIERITFFLREISGNEQQSKAQTNVHIRDANDILRNLCIESEKLIPAISLPEFDVVRAPQVELCKELPWEVRVRFAAICMYIAAENSYSVGGILMMTSGPRVAEVCAIQYGDILDFGDWGMCVINYTVDGDIRKGEGKNIYFRRPIFFPKFAMDAIHRRKDSLLNQGYTEEEIRTAYVINREGDVFSPENLHLFSAKIKRLLKIAGCDNDYWDAVRRGMTEQPDYDYFRRPEVFDIAYGLRRDATTQMCNVALMLAIKVDAILGHRLPNHAEKWDKKIKQDDEWEKIIEEMERIVYDPDHSNHPLFAPRKIEELMDMSIMAEKRTDYHGVSIISAKPVRVRVKVKTVGNSDVYYSMPKDNYQKSTIESVSNTAGPCQWLSALHSKREYDSVKAKAIADYLQEVSKDGRKKE